MLAQTVAHKTGIPIAAVDISPYKTHAILAGKEILKTVRIADRKITEDLNLRSAVISYASAHGSSNGGAIASKRRDFLSATDVKWSHGEYDSIIATASNNGRLSIYDIKRPEVELLWLHEHTRQVHKLGFNPFQGALLLSGSHDGTVKYWDLRCSSRERSIVTLNSTKQFSGRAEAVRDLRWSPTDGVEFVTCTDGGTIFKWDTRKPDRPELRINAHEKACYAIDWHPDGRHVVSGSADKNVRVWDFKKADRRQKPCFQLRAPQSIMNVRWRPASWSSPSQATGEWQSTQLAVGYNADDPRVHVWDLRRPLIPFRELDRYNSPATSLLWCTKDLLWTVGNEGMFTQTDVQYSRRPPEQISPCTVSWLGTGEYAVFTEDRACRRSSEDPSVAFRAAGHDEFSSGEQVTASRSMTDDEGTHEHLLGPSYKRTHANSGSVKSVKSLGNTPPSRDDQNPVLSLDQAIYDGGNMAPNRQVGVVGQTTGAAIALPTVRFLAENYARPATEAERKQNPMQVLRRLEEAFKTNGDLCDHVSMHRLGQTWRILGAVILPELQAWADQSRTERLNQVAPQDPTRDVRATSLIPGKQTPHTEGNKKAQGLEGGTGIALAAKPDLFKEIVRSEWQKLNHEAESTSNMTTPLARPMSDSTLATPNKSPHALVSLNDPLEPIPQLPLSLVAAHSTAAAASNALKSDAETSLTALPVDEVSSLSDRPRDIIPSVAKLSERHTKLPEVGHQSIKRSRSDWVSSGEYRSSDRRRREQNRRAALLEYKFQPRTVLDFDTSFEETSQKGLSIATQRHDSTESLQMFSESTSSSHKAKSTVSSESFGASYENKPSITSEDWDDRLRESYDPSSSSSRSPHDDVERPDRRTIGLTEHQRGVGRSSHRSDSPFPDGPFEFEQAPLKHDFQIGMRSVSRSPLPLVRQRMVDRQISPSPTPNELQSTDYIYPDFQPIDISSYYTNGHAKPWSALPLISQAIAFDLNLGENHAQFSTHLLMHIHPFFFHRKYRNKRSPLQETSLPQTLADRLLQPHLSHRIIESIFQQYHTFLKSLSLHVPASELRKLCVDLDVPSVYRPRLAPDEDPDTSLDDGFSLAITCTNSTCSAPLSLSAKSPDAEPTFCTRCHTRRPPCPICLSLQAPNHRSHTSVPTTTKAASTRNAPSSTSDGLWAFCQSCGHSAHMSCMKAWLRRPTTEGECPSAGCGHDCAPGQVRRRRLAALAAVAAAAATASANGTTSGEKQTLDAKMRNNGGGGEKKNNNNGARSAEGGGNGAGKNAPPPPPLSLSSSSSVKDAWKAPQSAAVGRTRGLLRSSVSFTVSSSAGPGAAATATGSVLSDREVGIPRSSAGGTSGKGPSSSTLSSSLGGGAAAAGSVGKKVVRLMTPGEEEREVEGCGKRGGKGGEKSSLS